MWGPLQKYFIDMIDMIWQKKWHYGLFFSSDWLQLKKSSALKQIYVGTNILSVEKHVRNAQFLCLINGNWERKNHLPMICKFGINDVCEFLSKDS